VTRSARVAAAALALCLLIAGAALLLGGRSRDSSPVATTTLPAAPSPVIGRPAPVDPGVTDARTAAQRFLGPYLRFLYGRTRPGSVPGTTAEVARELRRGRARPTPAQAQRRPRLAGLEVTLQTPGSAVAAATIADGGPAPYRIVLGLERHNGRWLVADLGND
jgi:hypothetical protein